MLGGSEGVKGVLKGVGVREGVLKGDRRGVKGGRGQEVYTGIGGKGEGGGGVQGGLMGVKERNIGC